MVGNGGSNGFVRYDVMQVPVNKYGFAVASTVSASVQILILANPWLIRCQRRLCQNNGHDGGLTDVTFALQNPESQEDFGYRAVRLH